MQHMRHNVCMSLLTMLSMVRMWHCCAGCGLCKPFSNCEHCMAICLKQSFIVLSDAGVEFLYVSNVWQ